MLTEDIVYDNAEHFVRNLRISPPIEATRKLTQFYVSARFRLDKHTFDTQYVDGANDGGIDFYHSEDNTSYIVQSKFTYDTKKTDVESIISEIEKINNTITNSNPNDKAVGFVNSLRREFDNSNYYLEIIWLTTHIVSEDVKEQIRTKIHELRNRNGWRMLVDFFAIDIHALDSVIYDINHGYVPYTGRRTLPLQKGEFITNIGEVSRIYSVVCNIRASDLLQWFKDKEEVSTFLQKNIREFLGKKTVNKLIAKSYKDAPDLFWYKHNGIIIFADSVVIDQHTTPAHLVLRNPQIVNGGQTLRTLFNVWDEDGRKDNTATLLIRAYRLPYEDSETYKKSIDIIEGLNSQNPIYPADLHSTDPRQVRLENLLKRLDYAYLRRRNEDPALKRRMSQHTIEMRKLALFYQACKQKSPHSAVTGNVQEIFSTSQYDVVFPEDEINKSLDEFGVNHVVFNYVTAWNAYYIVTQVKNSLPKRDKKFATYTKYFVLVDLYQKLQEWKKLSGLRDWREWKKLLESNSLRDQIWDYCKNAFTTANDMIPNDEEPRDYLKKTNATRDYNNSITGERNFMAATKRAYANLK